MLDFGLRLWSEIELNAYTEVLSQTELNIDSLFSNQITIMHLNWQLSLDSVNA